MNTVNIGPPCIAAGSFRVQCHQGDRASKGDFSGDLVWLVYAGSDEVRAQMDFDTWFQWERCLPIINEESL